MLALDAQVLESQGAFLHWVFSLVLFKLAESHVTARAEELVLATGD